jgi:hypothetical protein
VSIGTRWPEAADTIVVGGCSAHNAGAVGFGSRSYYDGWATPAPLGGPRAPRSRPAEKGWAG